MHDQENPTPTANEAAFAETEAPEQEAETSPEKDGATLSGATATDNWPEKHAALQDQFARLAADFDNFRKRMREEQEASLKYGAQKTVLELLPVLDNLERATASLTESSDPKLLFKSFGMLQKQLLDALDGLGVKKIQAIGQAFDPQFHEAVNRMSSAEFPENTVIFEAQSGYQLHDKLIRPAMVVVSTGPDTAAESATEETAAPAATSSEEERAANPFKR